MKKQIIILVALFVSILLVPAQQMPPIPVDAKVKIGKLDNGLTYYIRENKLPENRANFYIVQKVGSILEEDNQRGLAHFLEHMAFNGSKNFPAGDDGKSMISYLESIGVKFGVNLNAATGMDETIYNINDVPVTTKGAVESSLLILHDWSNFLLLRDKDIDKERKIIHEEWRTGQNAQMRVLEKVAPSIFKDSKYAYRFPIGTMEVIDNFEPQVLRDYYHKWYRPDLQSIIVVGDINAEEIEKQIRAIFADVKKPQNPAERLYENIPDNDEPLVAVETDSELPMNNVIIAYKRNIVPSDKRATMDYLVYDYAIQLIGNMLNDRLQEILQKNESPFAYAMTMNDSYFGVGTKDALQMIAVAKPNSIDKTISTLMTEAKRAAEFGFTDGEYERAKASYLSNMEKLYNEREKQKNSFYVQQYVEHFLKNEPIPSIEDHYNTMNQIVPSIPLTAINQIVKQLVSDKNRVVVLMGNDKEKDNLLSAEEIKRLINTVDESQIVAYQDNTVKEPLLTKLPTKGEIVKEVKDAAKGTTIWSLSNGAKVVIKNTDFQKDEVLLSATADGGSSLMDDKYMGEIKLMEDIPTIGGLGKFSTTDLKKNLSGKNAQVNFKVGTYENTISGKSSMKDVETLMQLVYLNFTDVRKDPEAYQSMIGRLKGILPTLAKNPDMIFQNAILKTMFMDNPRFTIPTVEELESASYDKLLELYKEQFANAGNFSFTFVGNVSDNQLKPLVEQYIASLPGTTTSKTKVKEIPSREGKYENAFTIPMETPKASTAIIISGKMPYTPENLLKLSVLGQLYQMEFTEKIREKEGGTYGVKVRQEAERLPKEGFTLQFEFDSDPERREALVSVMNKVTDALQQKGPDAAMLQKVKEFMLKQHADNLKNNNYIIHSVQKYYDCNVDLEKDYVKRVNELSVESMKQFAKQLIGQDNRVEVAMSSK